MGRKGAQGKLSKTHGVNREISKSSDTETQQLRERSLINPMYLWHCMAIDEEKKFEIKREDIGGLVNVIFFVISM